MATVRTELPRDFDAVRALLSLSFRRQAEARLVDRLRAAGKLCVALVAEDKARILGHVVFSNSVVSVEGVPANLVVLAPIAVMPAFQRLGIGSALVSAGLERARAQGRAGVLVLGDPAFYARFGFVPAARFGLKSPFSAPAESFMAIELEPGSIAGLPGAVRYAHEYDDLE